MKAILFLVVSSLFYDAAWSQDGFSSALCVFGCLDAFERKGVEGDLTTPAPAGGCNDLNFDDIISMCKTYGNADTCLRGCVNDDTKRLIITGLNYVCVDHFTEFQKYAPCFNAQCQTIEKACAPKCGSLAEAEDQWIIQLIPGNGTDSPVKRRKRQDPAAVDVETTTMDTTLATEDYAKEYTEAVAILQDVANKNLMDNCRFLGCYVNCSQPVMVNACGEDAFELLKYTAHMIFSFVLGPLKQGIIDFNVTVSENCDGLAMKVKSNSGTSTHMAEFWLFSFISAIWILKNLRF